MKTRYKIAIITGIILIIMRFALAEPLRVSGDCMEPAIKDGNLYFVNRISSYLRQYHTGDIIIFEHEEKTWISRIVALEGDTIQITEGSVIVNGVILQEKNIRRNWSGWDYGTYAINTSLQIPKDYVFVLSDNLPAQHDDSRVFGPISKKSISGLVW